VPRVSAWLVRASLLHLCLGFTIGAVLLVNKGFFLGAPVGALIPAHMELLLIGWVVQLVMGVAWWIFPRFGLRPTPPARIRLAWIAFGLLNVGVAAAALPPLITPAAEGAWRLAGRLVEVSAALVFAYGLRGRVAPGLSAM